MTEFFIALLLVALSHAFQARVGLDLADEGSLWNGVRRVARGEIPIRDFRAYDPGRYYWSWAWMRVLGDGILELRQSAAIFQFLGLWAGMLALGTATDTPWKLAAAGAICALWMQPRHKLYEHALSLFAVGVLVVVIQDPSPATLFLAGAYTGFAAIMGRNHGVWVLAATASLLLVLWFRGEIGPVSGLVGSWFAGIAAGYSPMMVMWVFIPGMFRRFWYNQVLVFLFVKRGRGGMPLPIPWPWKDKYAQPKLRDRISRLFLGLHFVVLPVFYIAALVWIILAPAGLENPLLVAACLVGIFYAHHAWRRADLSHLCQVIQPFLLGVFSLLFGLQNTFLSVLGMGLLAVFGYLTIRPNNPLIQKLEYPDKFVVHELNGSTLWVSRNQSVFLTRVKELISRNLGPEDSIFIAPTTPALYPILNLMTPIRSDFLLHRETEQVQNEAIRDLESNHVNWALVQDRQLDRRDDLRFKNSHAVMWDYLCTQFSPVDASELGNEWHFLKRRDEFRADVTQVR